MFQSPLKTVSEKIKPVSSKSSISSVKFDRASDFKKFINFIKKETKELEKIKIPKVSEVKGKSKRKGFFGLAALGIFGLLASGFGDGDGDGEEDKRFALAGGTKSQFKDIDLPLIRPLKRVPRDIDRVRTRRFRKSLNKPRSKIFRTKTPEEIKATDDVVKQQKKVNRKARNVIKKYNIIREEINASRPKKKINIAQVKSTLKDYFDPRVQKMAKQLGMADEILDPNLFALDDFMTLDLENLSEAEKANLTDKFLKAFPDDVPEGQFGKYSAEEMEKIEKLFGKQQESLFTEEDLLKEQKKELRKIRSKRYAFRGDPKFKFKFEKFGMNVKFTPKDTLNKMFTGIGQKTKTFRDNLSAGFSKIPIPKKVVSIAKPFLKKGAFVFDFATAGIELYKILEGFVVGDNILTSFYDLGVSIHNTFQPDKAKLITYITNSRDPRLKAIKDQQNQKILNQIQQAQQAQTSNNNVSPNNQTSNIIPLATQAETNAMIIPLSPSFMGFKFVMDKLYRQ